MESSMVASLIAANGEAKLLDPVITGVVGGKLPLLLPRPMERFNEFSRKGENTLSVDSREQWDTLLIFLELEAGEMKFMALLAAPPPKGENTWSDKLSFCEGEKCTDDGVRKGDISGFLNGESNISPDAPPSSTVGTFSLLTSDISIFFFEVSFKRVDELRFLDDIFRLT